jgi:hypothetical protein
VQEQGKVIEAHLMEQVGSVVEQHDQILVRDCRFRNGQQGSEAVAGSSCLSAEVSTGHGQNSWSVTRPELAALAAKAVILAPYS